MALPTSEHRVYILDILQIYNLLIMTCKPLDFLVIVVAMSFGSADHIYFNNIRIFA